MKIGYEPEPEPPEGAGIIVWLGVALLIAMLVSECQAATVLTVPGHIQAIEMPASELPCGQHMPRLTLVVNGQSIQAVSARYEYSARAVQYIPWAAWRVFCNGYEAPVE